jgi:hypothetical protein
MRARTLAILTLLALQLLLPSAAAARAIAWSGYTWEVRPAGFGDPGPNHWSDSPDNVRVEGSELVLSIVKDAAGRWTSAEVDNQQHLGYGTYRLVVASDLSALDAAEVLGMFTYGGAEPSHNEIDIEPSHWGNLAWPTGSATVWQDAGAGLHRGKTFTYSNRPPYVNQFTWEPGRIGYLITDATGRTLFRWTVTRGVPIPSSEVPMINYWRFRNRPPAGVRSMRLASFNWAPPGTVSDNSTAPDPASGGCPRLAMSPRRFAVRGRRRGAVIRWSGGALRLAVERRTRRGRFVAAGTPPGSVREAAGRLRFSGRVGGRRLQPGRYRLVGRSSCADTALSFRVLRG